MKLTVCGAARIVTGSNYLIEAAGKKFLVDCGMFQGPKEITRMNYEPFPYNPKEIDFVLLTHAHIDHSGLLPKLLDKGFYGPIYATSATKDLCKIMLADSAEMQMSQTDRENRKRKEQGLPPRHPLYTRVEAKDTMRLFQTVEYDERYEIAEGIEVRYRDAGHILGSAIIELFVEGKKLVFSGDLGQWDNPIICDPTIIKEADYLFIESTYGDRLHEDVPEREQLLAKYATETYKKGGKLFIPSFAVERTQELLYAIKHLQKTKRFPRETIFLDSPLAIKATNIFVKHGECYDEEARSRKNPIEPASTQYTSNVHQSKKINKYRHPCVVIAGSGMCTGGRIRHHLRNGIEDEKNTILFVGYQAEGTLGRYIVEGSPTIKMFGERYNVWADVKSIDGFSAHADQRELLKWAKGFKKKPKRVFVVHGEPKASEALKAKLEGLGFKAKIPSVLQKFTL
jgi:metallo-beta-lactamase family protein